MELWQESYDTHAPKHPDMPLQPNHHAYRALEAGGILQIVTARDDGVMVGYVIATVYPHMHHASTLWGNVDSFYLRAGSRRGRIGIDLVKEGIKHMKAAGARRITFAIDVANDSGALFRRLGFDKTHDVYALWVGD